MNVAETQSRQSRDSPIGGGSYSIVDEKVDNSTINADGMTPITKHTHRKSVFKKRGTSSPSMVSPKTISRFSPVKADPPCMELGPLGAEM